MAKMDTSTKDRRPIVKITQVNYDSAKQDEYSKIFMAPLIKGLLQRMAANQG